MLFLQPAKKLGPCPGADAAPVICLLRPEVRVPGCLDPSFEPRSLGRRKTSGRITRHASVSLAIVPCSDSCSRARAHTAYSSSSSVLHRARLLQTYRRVLQPTVSGNALQQIQLHGELKHSSGRVLLVTRPYGECFNSPSQPWSDLRLACLWGLSAAALLGNYAASLFGLWVLRTLWRCP